MFLGGDLGLETKETQDLDVQFERKVLPFCHYCGVSDGWSMDWTLTRCC
jgi:hypothetical protein